ncbi:MerR family transcriptional regulator [Georgenia halophila]
MTTGHGGAGPSGSSSAQTEQDPNDMPRGNRAGERGNANLDRHAGSAAPLTVAGVASRLGVAASTLRTWDRRYGLGPSSHVAGAHRKYTPDDVARLERMRQLTLQGVAPSDAARAASAFDPADPEAAPPPVPLAQETQPRLRVLVDPLSLAAAAVEPDPLRVQRMVEQEVEDQGVVRTWTSITGPALSMLARRDKTDLPGVEPESVLRAAFLTAVRYAVGQSASGEPAGELVLLCSGEEERLQAHVVGGGLAEHGIRARVLRAEQVRDPEQVLDAIDRRHAGVLAVLGNPPFVEDVVRAASGRGDIEIFLLGDDPPDLWLPHVHRVRTLGAAVEEIAAASRGES